MKVILKYSLYAIKTRPLDCLLIFLQLTVMLTALCIAIAQFNSRYMLYAPLDDMLSRKGFICVSDINDDDKSPDLIEQRIDTAKLKALGDVDIWQQSSYFGGEGSQLNASVISDIFFDKLTLPLTEGRHFKSDEQSDMPLLYVTPNSKGIKAGSILDDGCGNRWKVAGVLTDKTYIPHLSFDRSGSYENFYYTYDTDFEEGEPMFYTSEAMVKKLPENTGFATDEQFAIVTFNSDISEQEYAAARQKLDDDKDIAYTEVESIYKRSRKILSDDLKRLIPAVCVFGIVVLIGMISCSVISTKAIMGKLAVFCCCGATRRQCTLITAGQMLIITAAALTATAVCIWVMSISAYAGDIGFVLRENNIFGILAAAGTAGIISIIPPIVMIKRRKLREMI